MKKVKFKSDTNEFYGDYGDGEMREITEKECYRFVNHCNVKCVGSDENGYTIYILIGVSYKMGR